MSRALRAAVVDFGYWQHPEHLLALVMTISPNCPLSPAGGLTCQARWIMWSTLTSRSTR